MADLDFSWVARLVSLVVLPLADEDVAIIFGGYVVVNKLMPVGLAAALIYCGMVASDFLFYSIGVAARRIPWLNRFAVDDRVRAFTDSLQRNVVELVALCRVVPGIDLIVFVACGWTRVPLGRFMLASFVVSALYLPLMLYLVVMFGAALDDHVGLWTWPVLVAFVAVTGFVRHRIFALRDPSAPADDGGAGREQTPPSFRVFEARYRPVPEWRPRLRRVRAMPPGSRALGP